MCDKPIEIIDRSAKIVPRAEIDRFKRARAQCWTSAVTNEHIIDSQITGEASSIFAFECHGPRLIGLSYGDFSCIPDIAEVANAKP